MIMRNLKSVDWSLPFRQISSKQEFNQLDAQYYIHDNNNPISFEKREQIPIPQREVVKRVSLPKKSAKVTPNYIRGGENLNYPSAYNYEPIQVDHKFVEYNEQRFQIKGQKILTTEFLKKCITELQLKAGKNMNFIKNKRWIITFLEKEYKQLLQRRVFKQLCEIIYNHWMDMRRDFKRPLLRLFWKPNAGQYNYMVPFHPREREKRNLRRNNRKVETKVIKQLCQEFYLASRILESIQKRENLKLKQVTTQITSFYEECSPWVSLPQYMFDLEGQENLLFQNNSKQLTNMRLARLKLKHYLAFFSGIEEVQEQKAEKQ